MDIEEKFNVSMVFLVCRKLEMSSEATKIVWLCKLENTLRDQKGMENSLEFY